MAACCSSLFRASDGGGLLFCLPCETVQWSRVCNPIQDLTGREHLCFQPLHVGFGPELRQPSLRESLGSPWQERSCCALFEWLWLAGRSLECPGPELCAGSPAALCCSAIAGFRKPKGCMQKLSLRYTGRTGWNQHWCGAQPRLSTARGGA